MDLTSRYVRESRRVISDVEDADTTSPDMSRVDLVQRLTQATEMLRTMSDHAERLAESHAQLQAARDELEGRVRALQSELAASTVHGTPAAA
jgi:uncharacterized protein YhaN